MDTCRVMVKERESIEQQERREEGAVNLTAIYLLLLLDEISHLTTF